MKKPVLLILSGTLLISGSNLNSQIMNLLPVPQKVTWGKNKFQIDGAKVLITH